MAESWTMVRIKKSTHVRLSALRESLLKAYEEGRREWLPFGSTDQFSLDALINLLIDHKEDHRKRSKKSKAKKDTNGTCIHPPSEIGSDEES